jgi:hypothetical protein
MSIATDSIMRGELGAFHPKLYADGQISRNDSPDFERGEGRSLPIYPPLIAPRKILVLDEACQTHTLVDFQRDRHIYSPNRS